MTLSVNKQLKPRAIVEFQQLSVRDLFTVDGRNVCVFMKTSRIANAMNAANLTHADGTSCHERFHSTDHVIRIKGHLTYSEE